VDYLVYVKIINQSAVPHAIEQYSIEVLTPTNTWEGLPRLIFYPQGQLYFFHTVGPQLSKIDDIQLLDKELGTKAIGPGQSVSGFALFSYPAADIKLNFPQGVDREGIWTAQVVVSDIRVSIVDNRGSVSTVLTYRMPVPTDVDPTMTMLFSKSLDYEKIKFYTYARG
jgi:hypothetical protein